MDFKKFYRFYLWGFAPAFILGFFHEGIWHSRDFLELITKLVCAMAFGLLSWFYVVLTLVGLLGVLMVWLGSH